MFPPDKLPIFRQYKGLATMDTLVSPRSHEGDYYISLIGEPQYIYKPHTYYQPWIIRTWEVVPVWIREIPTFKGIEANEYNFLGHVRYENGVYITDRNVHLEVIKTSEQFSMRMDAKSIEPPPAKPHALKDYIDYKKMTWLCTNCGNEFNKFLDRSLTGRHRVDCFYCDHIPVEIVLMKPRNLCSTSAPRLATFGGYGAKGL